MRSSKLITSAFAAEPTNVQQSGLQARAPACVFMIPPAMVLLDVRWRSMFACSLAQALALESSISPVVCSSGGLEEKLQQGRRVEHGHADSRSSRMTEAATPHCAGFPNSTPG